MDRVGGEEEINGMDKLLFINLYQSSRHVNLRARERDRHSLCSLRTTCCSPPTMQTDRHMHAYTYECIFITHAQIRDSLPPARAPSLHTPRARGASLLGPASTCIHPWLFPPRPQESPSPPSFERGKSRSSYLESAFV